MYFKAGEDDLLEVVEILKAKKDETVKINMPIEAGKLIVKPFKERIKGFCFIKDIHVEIDERKGILTNKLLVLAKGRGEDVAALLLRIQEIKEELK